MRHGSDRFGRFVRGARVSNCPLFWSLRTMAPHGATGSFPPDPHGSTTTTFTDGPHGSLRNPHGSLLKSDRRMPFAPRAALPLYTSLSEATPTSTPTISRGRYVPLPSWRMPGREAVTVRGVVRLQYSVSCDTFCVAVGVLPGPTVLCRRSSLLLLATSWR